MRQTRLWLVYIVLQLPMLLLLSWIVPPMQAPDESGHYFHAKMIASGQIISRPFGTFWGGEIERSDLQFWGLFGQLPFSPDRKVEREQLDAAARLNDKAVIVQDLGSIPSYPPTAYAVQALGLVVADILGLNKIQSYRLGRAFGSIAFVLVTALAIRLTPASKEVFGVILFLPMTMFLASSFSADAHVISVMALITAIMGREANRPKPTESGLCWISLLLISASNTKLNLILFCIPLFVLASRQSFLRAVIHVAVVLGFFIVWSRVFVLNDIMTAKFATVGADTKAQISYLLHNPLAIYAVGMNTLSNQGPTLFQQMIGVLGWLDTPMDMPVYWAASIAMVVVVTASALGDEQVQLRLALAVAVGLSFAAVFGLLYLSWTPAGAQEVAGAQGRYFLPLLFPLALIFSGMVGSKFHVTALPIAILFWMISAPFTIKALIYRYYL